MVRDYQRWSKTSYKLISFQLTDQFVGVWAEEAEDGMYDLVARPIQAIGLAIATTRYYKKATQPDGEPTEFSDSEDFNQLVSLELWGGEWSVCEEFDNFAGTCRHGDDITKIDTNLSIDKSKLRKRD